MLNSSRTVLVYYDKFPSMNHIRILDSYDEGGIVARCIFGQKGLMMYLEGEGFDRYHRNHPTSSIVKKFHAWEAKNFAKSAARLPMDS